MSAGASEPVGGPGEEARRLVEALSDWATTRLGTVDAQVATGSAACQVCPICQLISALRGDGPEVLSRLSAAWTAFLGALAEHSHPADGPDPAATSDAPAAQAPADLINPARPVQNIDVR